MAVRIVYVVGLFVVFGLCSALALGDQDEKDLSFLDSIKNLESFNDARIQDQVLVLWPNPETQNFLDFERTSKALCAQRARNKFLVIWLMDSAHFRSNKEYLMIESFNCLALEAE
jgi:hypothetical protein